MVIKYVNIKVWVEFNMVIMVILMICVSKWCMGDVNGWLSKVLVMLKV